MERTLTHIDCFAGPGGICTGLHAAGLQTLAAIECIGSCCDTYQANHPEVHVIHSDIRDVTAEQLLPLLPKDGVDLVTSGMPCETFSTAGNTSRSFYDDRQYLFREGIRIAKISQAKMLLFENVPAITSKKAEKDSNLLIVDILKKELEEAGYGNYLEVVLNSTRFGVPQRRNRFFILACRYPDWQLHAPEGHSPTVSVREALAGLPDVIANSGVEGTSYTEEASAYSRLMRDDRFWRRKAGTEKETSITNHLPMKHRACTLKRFALLHPGESLKALFDRYTGEERERLQAERILPKKMFIKRNYRLKAEEPSPTVTSHCLDEFVHPSSNRALTVRECARLQSFPDSYEFVGGPYIVPHIDRTVQDKYEQIGDAVPPLLAYAWGKQIVHLFETNENRPMTDGYYQFCLEAYRNEYEKSLRELEKGHASRRLSEKKLDEFDREAQKSAIRAAITQALRQFPNESVAELWSAIYRAHLFRKSGISDLEVINKVISADQSWKKSSGHAFEEMVKELASLALQGTGIEVVLQRDLNLLIKDGGLANEPRDISWLKEQIKANIFDLYCLLSTEGKKYCFGCVQAKTSIRDRVTRDREPSIHAMQSFFWSVAFVLDGDFLRLPKFMSMINGGSEEFHENGWHGMYVLSAKESNGRIYPLATDFTLFKSHALQAAGQWTRQRQWFNPSWKAE